MGNNPKWVNPTRQAELVKLFGRFGNRCLLGHLNCPIKDHYKHVKQIDAVYSIPQLVPCEDTHGNKLKDSQGNQLYNTIFKVKHSAINRVSLKMLYDVVTNERVHEWVLEDNQVNRDEHKARHKTTDRRYPVRVLIPENGKGKLSGVSKDIEYDSQPLFYFEGLGFNALTFRPFAKVRLGYNFMRLHVDIGDCLKSLSKHKRRKAIRQGIIPSAIEQAIYQSCWLAVQDYLNE